MRTGGVKAAGGGAVRAASGAELQDPGARAPPGRRRGLGGSIGYVASDPF